MLDKQLIEKVKRLEIATKRLLTSQLMGHYQSAFKGTGVHFSDARPYHYGDDVRAMNWAMSARLHAPHINLYDEEREVTVYVVVDVSGSAMIGSVAQSKLEKAAEIAAILGFSAQAHADKVGLLLFADTVVHHLRPSKGRRHMLRLLRDVYSASQLPPAKTNIELALRTIMHTEKKSAIVCFISDFIDSGYQQALHITAKKHDVIPVVIQDPLEQALPNVGTVAFSDRETHDVVYVNTASKEVRRAYKNMQYARCLEQERVFKQAGCRAIRLLTTQDPIVALSRFFKQRAHL